MEVFHLIQPNVVITNTFTVGQFSNKDFQAVEPNQDILNGTLAELVNPTDSQRTISNIHFVAMLIRFQYLYAS